MAFDFDRALLEQGKALAPHPALMSREPVGIYSPGATRENAIISQREASRHSDAYGGAQAIDWVYDCIGLYSDAAATATFRLEKDDGTKLVRNKTKGTPPEYELGPKSLYDLLDKPNPYMLYDELMALVIIDWMLVGNAYWYKWRPNAQGQPLAIYRLAPSHVKIKPGPYGPKHYEYQPPGAREKLKIPPQDLIHFRRPNPHSAFYGMGVIQGAGRSMDLELALTDTISSYYENKADPSLIVSSERRMPRDVYNKLRAQMRARVSGSKKAGELLVLEAGLKASSLDVSAADALFEQLAKMSRDRIFAKFRASPMLFGLMDETSGSNKVSDARREFDNSALRPALQKLSTQITVGLAAAWDVKYVIDHRSYLPAEEAIKVLDSMAKLPGIKIREIRKQAEQFGLEESTGDPEIDNKVINVPTEELDEDGMNSLGIKGPADQPIGGEPGRPPKMENTVAFGTAASSKVVTPKGKALSDFMAELEQKAMAPDGARVTIGNVLPDEKRPDDVYAKARHADIDATVSFIERGLGEAAQELEAALLQHVEGKALKSSDLVSRIKQSAAWTQFRERVAEVLEEGARRAAASGAMHSGLNPADEIDYDVVAKSIVHRPEGLRSILKTLRERVSKSVKDARDGNAERAEYQQAVKDAIATWSTNQASLIAETEAVNAYNEATLTMAELSGATHVFVTDGEDDDAPCVEANESVWEIETARERRLEHPRCRRAFLPLTAGTVA